MSKGRASSAGWFDRSYGLVRRAAAGLLRIPLEPARIPVGDGDLIESFHPDPGWLRLRKLQALRTAFFGILGLVAVAVVLRIIEPSGYVSFGEGAPSEIWGAVRTLDFYLGAFLLGGILVITVVKLVTVRLLYDCTWYAMTTRAMRIRQGIWVINETTITYANIQNVTIRQGPLERFFRISTIEVETAGGGGLEAESQGHTGRLEGIGDPERLRRRIMERVRASRTAGLGDEAAGGSRGTNAPAHGEIDLSRMAGLLDEIRSELLPGSG